MIFPAIVTHGDLRCFAYHRFGGKKIIDEGMFEINFVDYCLLKGLMHIHFDVDVTLDSVRAFCRVYCSGTAQYRKGRLYIRNPVITQIIANAIMDSDDTDSIEKALESVKTSHMVNIPDEYDESFNKIIYKEFQGECRQTLWERMVEPERLGYHQNNPVKMVIYSFNKELNDGITDYIHNHIIKLLIDQPVFKFNALVKAVRYFYDKTDVINKANPHDNDIILSYSKPFIGLLMAGAIGGFAAAIAMVI